MLLWLCIVGLAIAALLTLVKAAEALEALTQVTARLGALRERVDLALEVEVVPLFESLDEVRGAGERLRAQTLGLATRLVPGAPALHSLETKALAAAGLAHVFLRFATDQGEREQV